MNPCELLQWCLAILVLLVIYIYWKTREAYKFWQSRNIPCRKPTFLVGDFADVLLGKKSLGEAAQDTYNEFKNKGPYAGFSMMLSPRLVVMDPEAIKNVLVKDFQNFNNHGSYHNEKDDPLSAHLFAVEGEKWRRLRVKLSPTFTSGKMKMMFETMMENVNELEDYMDKAVSQNSVLEIKDILARFTTDIIGSCALGIQCNTLKDTNAEFREIGRRIITNKFYTAIKRSFTTSYRNLARKLKFKIVDPKVSKFFFEHNRKNNKI
uniref:Putative cytochrome p450 cyp3/cyp5/cyp6/cyp9 subfamily n=1 Tax=Xenopsylla cheopis TaxID=163159 RepID=A0A6M2DZI3_XENCH